MYILIKKITWVKLRLTVIIVFLNCITGPNPSTTQTRNRNISIYGSYYINKWSHSTYLMTDFWGFDCVDVEIRSLMDQIEACTQDNTPDQNTARTALFHIKPQHLNPSQCSNYKLQTCKITNLNNRLGCLNMCFDCCWFCCVLSNVKCLSDYSPDKMSEISPLSFSDDQIWLICKSPDDRSLFVYWRKLIGNARIRSTQMNTIMFSLLLW